MRYRHIFFDLDRTLWDFDTNAYHTLKELYAKHALESRGIASFPVFLERYKQINDEMWTGYGKGEVTKEMLRYERFHRALKEHGVDDPELSRNIGNDYVALSPIRTTLFPFTENVLEYLSAKYRLYILTNGFEEVQHLKLQASGIRKYFHEVITSERAGYKKPDKRMFDYAIRLAETSAADALMIGDSLEIDIAGARNAGMDHVYFNPSRQQHSEPVTYEIGCLSELVKLL